MQRGGAASVRGCLRCAMGDLVPILHKAFKTPRYTRIKQAQRRNRLTAAGVCLNGPTHGSATHGRRCDRCYHVWKHGYAKAIELGLIEPQARRPAMRCVNTDEHAPAEERVGSK